MAKTHAQKANTHDRKHLSNYLSIMIALGSGSRWRRKEILNSPLLVVTLNLPLHMEQYPLGGKKRNKKRKPKKLAERLPIGQRIKKPKHM